MFCLNTIFGLKMHNLINQLPVGYFRGNESRDDFHSRNDDQTDWRWDDLEMIEDI